MEIKIKKLHPRVNIPNYAHAGDSGLPLTALIPYFIRYGAVIGIHTGLAIEIPEGYEGQIRARSGLAMRYGITMANGIGTIDSNYRGELICLMTSLIPGVVYEVREGENIAQLVITKVETVTLIEEKGELNDTTRGANGFGSTGK